MPKVEVAFFELRLRAGYLCNRCSFIRSFKIVFASNNQSTLNRKIHACFQTRINFLVLITSLTRSLLSLMKEVINTVLEDKISIQAYPN